MKKRGLLVFLCLTLVWVGSALGEGVPLDENCFPDALFRGYLAQTFDVDGDSALDEEELQSVRVLFVQEKGIRSLQGIEWFPLLESLACWGNELTALDLRGNPALRDVACGNNRLKSLNVNGCTLLEDLACQNNDLTFLDVSGNPALRYLDCWGNPLTGLNLSGNQKLDILRVNSIPGDVNGDFTVDGRDLLRLVRYLAGHKVVMDASAADLTGDGSIDGRDVLRLARRLAGN